MAEAGRIFVMGLGGVLLFLAIYCTSVWQANPNDASAWCAAGVAIGGGIFGLVLVGMAIWGSDATIKRLIQQFLSSL